MQIVLGPIADQVAGDMRKVVSSGPSGRHRTRAGIACSPALGGRANLVELAARSSRLLVEVRDPAKVAEADLAACAPRGVVRTAPTRWQIIVGPQAEAWAENSGA